MEHIVNLQTDEIDSSSKRFKTNPFLWPNGETVPGKVVHGRTTADGAYQKLDGVPGEPSGSGSQVRDTGVYTFNGTDVIEGRERYDPPPPPPEQVAMNEINRLEGEVTQRRIRDAGADDAGGTVEGRAWMANQEALIAVQRAKLQD